MTIHFSETRARLCIDTVQVNKAPHYGFSVVNASGDDIATNVVLTDSTVTIVCEGSPERCKVRYAVNGDPMKSGCLHGPRGNLRDEADNWCYQFDIPMK